MPFVYELKIAAGEHPAEFVQQLAPKGSMVEAGQPVATLTDGAMDFHVFAPRQGLLAEWLVEHGDEIEPGDVLARIVCEGAQIAIEDVRPVRLGGETQ
jgi:biotin carboxyl carrier protein